MTNTPEDSSNNSTTSNDSPTNSSSSSSEVDENKTSSSSSSSSWIWPTSRNEQDEYRTKLRLSSEQSTKNRNSLGKIVYVCHALDDLDCSKVAIGGSVGKGTASSYSADLDLIVYIDWLEPRDMKHEVPGLLKNIQDAIDSKYPGTRIQISGNDDDDSFSQKQKLLQNGNIGLRYKIAGMDINVLVGGANVIPMDFLDVKDIEQRIYMNPSVSTFATKYMRRQTVFFHDMVRIAKHWIDSFKTWDSSSSSSSSSSSTEEATTTTTTNYVYYTKPKPYLLEILMLEAFRKLGFCSRKGNTFNNWSSADTRFSQRVLLKFFDLIGMGNGKKLTNNNTNNSPTSSDDEEDDDDDDDEEEKIFDSKNLPPLFICFEPFYKRSNVPLDNPEPIFELKQQQQQQQETSASENNKNTEKESTSNNNNNNNNRKATAIVMDPVNPTNNLWLTCGGNTKLLVKRAKTAAAQIRSS